MRDSCKAQGRGKIKIGTYEWLVRVVVLLDKGRAGADVPRNGLYNGTSCPSALDVGRDITMCTLSCRYSTRSPPAPVGPLMTLRVGWRLGQANYMARRDPIITQQLVQRGWLIV